MTARSPSRRPFSAASFFWTDSPKNSLRSPVRVITPGLKDLATGKRFWAHGPTGDVNPADPAVVVWFELQRKGKDVSWVKHEIDNDSGVGTQFAIADLNGDKRPDIITSNKKGVHVFVQY